MIRLFGALLIATAVSASGSSPKTRRICVNGDPHYTTFDGAYYDYQGNCPYTFSTPCNGQLDNGYSTFSVKAKNEVPAPHTDAVSYVGSTQIVFYDKTIYVDQFMNVFVDDAKVYVPYYYPSKSDARFSITLRNGDIVIKNDQLVEVNFHYGQLCLSIPDVPEFRGPKTLCGLAGNFDGNCTNDLVKPDGTVISNSCRPSQSETDKFADSWITADYFIYTQSTPPAACIPGGVMTSKSHTCKDIAGAGADCVDIYNAAQGTGPFAACQVLGQDAIQMAYDSCIYDVCLKNQNTWDAANHCTSYTDFAQSCQLAIGGSALANWRSSTGCDIECPGHSSYTNCVPTCAETCAGPASADECEQPCTDGCACDAGYVLDTTNLTTVSCIPLDQCGCTDNNGNVHPGSQRWISDDCSTENYCQDRKVSSKSYSACPVHTHCGVSNGAVDCAPGDPVNATGTDNYCKCGIVDGWFDNWDPEDIWVDVVVILDTSMSMATSFYEAKAVVTSFVGLMSTDTTAEFYSRIGVIAASDTMDVIYNLNMSSSDDLDRVQQQKQIDKIDIGAAFQAALNMFADSSYRKNAKQIIYYLTHSAPDAYMKAFDDFKNGGGIVIVNDFITEGEVSDPGLQKLASYGYFFTDLSETHIKSLGVFCEANCFCASDAHPFNDDDNSPRTRANRGCFHPFNYGYGQQDARAMCRKYYGALVSIHDSEKEFFVNSVVSIFGPKNKFWLGLQFDGTNWNWDDQSTDPFTDWDVKNGQPNTYDGQLKCAYAQQGTGFNTPWTAANCGMGGVIYVCESAPCSVGYKNCV